LPLTDVVEVLPMVALDAPGAVAGPFFRGLLIYRQSVVPVFDTVAEPLPWPEAVHWMLVLMGPPDGRVAVVVSRVDEVVQAPFGAERVAVGGALVSEGLLLDDGFVPVLPFEALAQ
jgi:chemotaxis signal transduction protein